MTDTQTTNNTLPNTLNDAQKLQMRASLEMSGMLNSKQGLIMLYTCVYGMDIVDALPKIKAECELRGIDLNGENKPKPTGIDAFFVNVEKVSVFLEKNPKIAEVAQPFLTGAVTAVTSLLIGKKIGESEDNHTDDEDIVIENLDDDNDEDVEVIENEKK